MNSGLVSIRVPALDGAAAWAAGLDMSVPPEIELALRNNDVGSLRASERFVDQVRLHAAFTPPPASTRLPFSYQFVPLRARTFVGHLLGRMQRRRVSAWAKFPRWPLDLSADFVADLLARHRSPFSSEPAPVLLSHDIDTAAGLANLVPRFLPIEESVGARSSNYVVPCAWELDHGLLEEVTRRGHELGIHGYDHSNKTPYADSTERDRRIAAAMPLVKRYGMIGYRAPSLVRTPSLFEALEGSYRYDSSVPTSGGLFPTPNNGCATARPFYIGNLLEIPLSLPRDGSLRFLGHRPDGILAIWKQCAEAIAASGGIVSLLTHCEERFSGNQAMLAVYEQFLQYLASDSRYAFSTPAQVLERITAPAR